MTPQLLRGAMAIGARLNMGAKQTQAMIQAGKLPTFRHGGTPYATAGALDEWRQLYLQDKLPREQ